MANIMSDFYSTKNGNKTFEPSCSKLYKSGGREKKDLKKEKNENYFKPKSSNNYLRYKTELCRSYEESGICRFGEGCTFAHGFQELRAVPRHPRYKTEACRSYQTLGFCQYGIRCHFIHGADDLQGVTLVKSSRSPPSPSDSAMNMEVFLCNIQGLYSLMQNRGNIVGHLPLETYSSIPQI